MKILGIADFGEKTLVIPNCFVEENIFEVRHVGHTGGLGRFLFQGELCVVGGQLLAKVTSSEPSRLPASASIYGRTSKGVVHNTRWKGPVASGEFSGRFGGVIGGEIVVVDASIVVASSPAAAEDNRRNEGPNVEAKLGQLSQEVKAIREDLEGIKKSQPTPAATLPHIPAGPIVQPPEGSTQTPRLVVHEQSAVQDFPVDSAPVPGISAPAASPKPRVPHVNGSAKPPHPPAEQTGLSF